MRRNNTPAPYSNISDLPKGDGVATFGGNSNATTDKTNSTDGMLGVYIGTYPDNVPNTTGFARWAGTSFATPVITGALAVLVADGYTTDDAIQKLRDTNDQETHLGEVFRSLKGNRSSHTSFHWPHSWTKRPLVQLHRLLRCGQSQIDTCPHHIREIFGF